MTVAALTFSSLLIFALVTQPPWRPPLSDRGIVAAVVLAALSFLTAFAKGMDLIQ